MEKKCFNCKSCVVDQQDGEFICTKRGERVDPDGSCEEHEESNR